MAGVKLKYALDNNKNLVSVDEVANGLACNCFCPACNCKLEAKQGEIRVPLSSDAPKNLRRFCNSVIFYDSIGALKRLTVKQDGNGCFGVVVPPDYYPSIMKYSLTSMTAILNAQVVVGKSDIFQIFSEVDNKVLDVLMFLEQEFGVLDDLDINLDLKTEDDIKSIQNQINFYIYNDNRVTIGDENEISDSVISVDSEIKQ